MIRENRICICFSSVPEGTRYRAGAYSWVPLAEGLEYIKSGAGVEWDPGKGPAIHQVPTMNDTKKEIQDYLDSQEIQYSESMTKSELLEAANGERDSGEPEGAG